MNTTTVSHDSDSPTGLFPVALTLGFATAIAMWLVGFITHLPGLRAPAIVVGILLILMQVLGGIAAGVVWPSRAWALGTLTGGIASLVNLLIVGSVLTSETGANDLRPGWHWLIGGFLLFGILTSGLAALIFSRRPGVGLDAVPRGSWLPRFAILTCISAIPVLLTGGLVTSTNTGLAVPDWPTSYSANMFLYPLSKMTGGIYYEHAHRLFGSLVGFTTLVLCIYILIADRRWLAKGLGLLALLMVIGQGVLGGIRVTAATATDVPASPETLIDNSSSLTLAMIHGTTAQLFFAFLCALAAVLSARWRNRTADSRSDPDSNNAMRTISLVLFGALCMQLVLGAMTRHFHQQHALWTHAGFAIVILVLAVVAGARASSRPRIDPILRRLGRGCIHAVGLQLLLGLATFIAVTPYQAGYVDPPYAVILATSHQAVGALLLATAAVLFAWSLRLHASNVTVGAAPMPAA